MIDDGNEEGRCVVEEVLVEKRELYDFCWVSFGVVVEFHGVGRDEQGPDAMDLDASLVDCDSVFQQSFPSPRIYFLAVGGALSESRQDDLVFEQIFEIEQWR